MDNKLSHMSMIQDVVKRMASNSFMLKGWAVTLVAGVFALASKDVDKRYFLIAYVPIIAFWGLDSYYLLQGRLFRAIYEKVRNVESKNIDFNMKLSNMEIKELNLLNKNKYTLSKCIFSKTEIVFYLPLAILTLGIVVLTNL